MSESVTLKNKVHEVIDGAAGNLVDLSLRIHSHPELAFREHLAADAVAAICKTYGFTGGRGAAGIDTAVREVFGGGSLNIGLCAEYDALPGIGHACGHNLIAGASVGAAIGLASISAELGI